MSKLFLLSITGLGGTAGIGGGIYLLQRNYNTPDKETTLEIEKKTIQTRLQKAGFQILDINDNQHWGTLKTAYNGAKQEATKVFETSESDIDEDKLKSFCQSFLGKSEDDESYEKVKRWCVVPVTVSNHLESLGRKLLSTASSGEVDKEEWEGLASKYDKSPNKISGVERLEGSNKWETLRSKCGALGTKKNYEDGFDVNLRDFVEWCSVLQPSRG